MGYCVDIALCLDTTGAMNAFLETLRCGQEFFSQKLLNALEKRIDGKVELRLRIVGYRDFGRDGMMSLIETEFFSFPEEESAFKDALNAFEARGGGDIPEDSLEAFAVALKSDWTQTMSGAKVRHVIFIATDAPSHPFGYSREKGGYYYPEDLPKDETELELWWKEGVPGGTFSSKAGRLAVLAPNGYPWNQITEKHNVWVEFDNSAGLNDVEQERVIELLVEAAFGQSVY